MNYKHLEVGEVPTILNFISETHVEQKSETASSSAVFKNK